MQHESEASTLQQEALCQEEKHEEEPAMITSPLFNQVDPRDANIRSPKTA